jgi:hypothetical protein
MDKELSVCGIAYSFSFNESLNLWRVVGSQNLLSGYKIDLEVNLNLTKKDIDWSELSKFISYLQARSYKVNSDTIDKSKIALKGLFNGIYKDSLAEEVKVNVDFELSGIDYRKTLVSSFGSKYEYDMFFFPYNSIDRNMDMGSFVWRAKMRGNVLYGVDCDI